MWVVNDSNADSFFEGYVRDRRLVLVGPSQSALSNTYEFIEAHDLVVRVNYAYPTPSEHVPYIGSRCDVLYHNSAGLRDIQEILQPGLEFIWYDRNRHMFDIRRFLKATNTPGGLIRPYRDRVISKLGTHPNMGFLALMHLLSQPIQSLHVTGITFFREPYHTGYPETKFGNSKEIKTRSTPSHDADLQFEYFVENLYNDARLTVDDTLQRICDEHLRSTNST